MNTSVDHHAQTKHCTCQCNVPLYADYWFSSKFQFFTTNRKKFAHKLYRNQFIGRWTVTMIQNNHLIRWFVTISFKNIYLSSTLWSVFYEREIHKERETLEVSGKKLNVSQNRTSIDSVKWNDVLNEHWARWPDVSEVFIWDKSSSFRPFRGI